MKHTQLTQLTRSLCVVVLGLALMPLCAAAPLGTLFSYQGRLTDVGNPATGTFDFQFYLYDQPAGESQQGTTLTNLAVAVNGGLFTVPLDFGTNFNSGQGRWLEIHVRTNGGASYSVLSPRQPLHPTPYALYAPTAGTAATAATATSATTATTATSVPWSALTGLPPAFADGVDNDTTYSAGTGLNLAGTTFSLNAAYTDALYWKVGGNNGTAPGANFLGTSDNQPFELKVNGARALRLEPGTSPNLIGGTSANLVGAGVAGAVVGGGDTNQIGVNSSYSTIGGGGRNLATNQYATIPGGAENVAGGAYSLAAGRKARAVHSGTFVWADSAGTDFSSAGPNEFAVRATGGVRLETGSAELLVNGQPVLRASGGSFNQVKPYQAGALSLTPFVPFTTFQSRVINQPITFPEAFSAAPIVTVALETTQKTAPPKIAPIVVRQKTTNGFSLSFSLPNLPVMIDPRGSDISRAPVTIVNGRPAVAYRSGANLVFARAQDSTGQRWGAGVPVTGGDPREIDLLVVNGAPAVALRDSNGNLKYVRANDADGTSWGAPATIQAMVAGSFRAVDISLAVVAGNPAIACFDSDGGEVHYFRATDANGTAWPAAGILVTVGSGAVTLLEVNGRPAISYGWDNGLNQSQVGYQVQLRYLRASDTLGATWPATPATILTGSNFELVLAATLQLINSNPAVLFEYFQGGLSPRGWLRFARATNVDGTAWGAVVDVSAGMQFVGGHGAGTVAGRPAVVWYDTVSETLRYSESSNLGASFTTAIAFQGVRNSLPSVTDVQGRPGLTLSSSQDGELLYMRDGNPIIDTFINWIAIEP